jgi:hypothetical protein
MYFTNFSFRWQDSLAIFSCFFKMRITAKEITGFTSRKLLAIVHGVILKKVNKPMNLFRSVILLLLCLVATACAGTASQEGAVASTPTVATSPEDTPTFAQEEAVATAAPAEAAEAPEAASQAETDWLTVEGKTEDNLTFLGNPEAPVTLIDHSDFL